MPTTLRNVFQNAEITHAQRARLRTVKKAGKAAPSDMDYELVARGLLVAVVATDGPLTVALNPDAEGVFNENGTCVLPIVGGPVQSYLVDVLPPDSHRSCMPRRTTSRVKRLGRSTGIARSPFGRRRR